MIARSLVLATLVAGLALPPGAWADPPPWAPAHGWRKKHDPYYQGYSGKKWEDDYGIVSGRCNRQAVGAVLGGVVGGAIGSQVGKGEGRRVATLVGAIIGAAVGAKIGRDMDEADRACVAHALELAGPSARVRWTNPDTGVAYLLTPTRDYKRDGHACRDYTLKLTADRKSETRKGSACQSGEGVWKLL